LSCRVDVADKVNNIQTDASVLVDRIPPPAGFHRNAYDNNSWQYYLRNLPLHPDGTKVLDYRGQPISNQSDHIAVLDIDVGTKDLQQCADAIIRLRAEYLLSADREDDIAFHFTSGDLFSWNDYANGIRPVVHGNSVIFQKKAKADRNYNSFRNYLDQIFMYAGTISMHKEMRLVNRKSDIRAGDIIISPGSPGHAVLIIDEAINDSGVKVFLLANGYTPAQSIHILTNPWNRKIGPWYELDVSGSLITARYTFQEVMIKRFQD
jgi:hypothetical protein